MNPERIPLAPQAERPEPSYALAHARGAIESAEHGLVDGMTEHEAWEYRHELGVAKSRLDAALHAAYQNTETPDDIRKELQETLTYLEEIQTDLREAFPPGVHRNAERREGIYASTQHSVEVIRAWLDTNPEDRNMRLHKADQLGAQLRALQQHTPVSENEQEQHAHATEALQRVIEDLRAAPVSRVRPRRRNRNTSSEPIKDTRTEDEREEDEDERKGTLAMTRNAIRALMGEHKG